MPRLFTLVPPSRNPTATEADAYYNRGNIYAETEFGFWQALADFTKTIELDPASSDAYVNIGVLFVKRGALEEGLPFLEKAAQMGDSLGMQFAELVRQELGDV
jgi:tetratricopeptide (TPR) repeat protein